MWDYPAILSDNLNEGVRITPLWIGFYQMEMDINYLIKKDKTVILGNYSLKTEGVTCGLSSKNMHIWYLIGIIYSDWLITKKANI